MELAFACPRCRADVEHRDEAYHCASCSSAYPIVLGIPDFRIEPDPWISLEDDREKARRLIANTNGLDLARSVEAYWAMTPTTPAEYARKFIEYVMSGERRAAEWLDTLPPPVTRDAPWLEIGCASGDLLAVCATRGVRAVGVDVAMRWLVLARKRAALMGDMQVLVCANGEHLPFRDASFARVVSVGTLEHCTDAQAVFTESARVLRASGGIALRTTNRYSLLPEPHVNVWGVGFVPRRWADAYVRWRSGQSYAHHHPLSAHEIGVAMRRAGFSRVEVWAARMLASDRERLGGAGALAPVYEIMRSLPLASRGVRTVAPLLEARALRS